MYILTTIILECFPRKRFRWNRITFTKVCPETEHQPTEKITLNNVITEFGSHKQLHPSRNLLLLYCSRVIFRTTWKSFGIKLKMIKANNHAENGAN